MVILVLQERYYLVVSGSFDREPIVYDVEPTNQDIASAIKELNGESARVEKRYVLGERK